jgi:hypothetical protein
LPYRVVICGNPFPIPIPKKYRFLLPLGNRE